MKNAIMLDEVVSRNPYMNDEAALAYDSDSSGDSKLHTILERNIILSGTAPPRIRRIPSDRRDGAPLESPLRVDHDQAPPSPLITASPTPYSPYYNAYSQRDYSPSVQPSTPRKGLSSWMDAILRTPNQVNTDNATEEEKEEDDVSVDSVEELEQVSLRIRSEIRQKEMQELAVEAEHAAEAGLESFAGRASTFGDPTHDLAKKPKPLKRYKTYSEGTRMPRSSSLQASLESLRRIKTEPKIRVLALRNINEVIPPMGELHMHLRTHFVLSGVNPQCLSLDAKLKKEEPTNRGDSVTPVQFLNTLTSWVSQKPSDGRSTPKRSVSNAAAKTKLSPDSLMVHVGENGNHSVRSQVERTESFDAYEVGVKLSGHLHRPEAVRLSPIRLPTGLDLPDDIEMPDKLMFADFDGATLGTVPTSSSSLNGQDAQQGGDEQEGPPVHDMNQFTPVALFERIGEEDSHDEPASPGTGSSSGNSLLEDSPPERISGRWSDMVGPNTFVTPMRLRGIRNSPKARPCRSVLHEATDLGWTLKTRELRPSRSDLSNSARDDSDMSIRARAKSLDQFAFMPFLHRLLPRPSTGMSSPRSFDSKNGYDEHSLSNSAPHLHTKLTEEMPQVPENLECPISTLEPPRSLSADDHDVLEFVVANKREYNEAAAPSSPSPIEEEPVSAGRDTISAKERTKETTGSKPKRSSSSVVIRVIDGTSSNCNASSFHEYETQGESSKVLDAQGDRDVNAVTCKVDNAGETSTVATTGIQLESASCVIRAESPQASLTQYVDENDEIPSFDEIAAFYESQSSDRDIGITASCSSIIETARDQPGLQMPNLDGGEGKTSLAHVPESDPISDFYSDELSSRDESVEQSGGLVVELRRDGESPGDIIVPSSSMHDIRKALLEQAMLEVSLDHNEDEDSVVSAQTPLPHPCECLMAAASSIEETMARQRPFKAPTQDAKKTAKESPTPTRTPQPDPFEWHTSATSSMDSVELITSHENSPAKSLYQPRTCEQDRKPPRRTLSCPSLAAVDRPFTPAPLTSTSILHKKSQSEYLTESPTSPASDNALEGRKRRHFDFAHALRMDPCQSASPFKETMDDMIKNLSPKKDSSSVKKRQLLQLKENHDFLNNYLYCSKPKGKGGPEKTDGNICGLDGCEFFSGVLDTYRSIIPTRRANGKELLSLDAGNDSLARIETETWFDVASEHFDGALETLVGNAHAHGRRWNAMFQAPILKAKKGNEPSTPSRKAFEGIVLVNRTSTVDSDHELSDRQFHFLYGMTREEFVELPVTERSVLHDIVHEKRNRWMQHPTPQMEHESESSLLVQTVSGPPPQQTVGDRSVSAPEIPLDSRFNSQVEKAPMEATKGLSPPEIPFLDTDSSSNSQSEKGQEPLARRPPDIPLLNRVED